MSESVASSCSEKFPEFWELVCSCKRVRDTFLYSVHKLCRNWWKEEGQMGHVAVSEHLSFRACVTHSTDKMHTIPHGYVDFMRQTRTLFYWRVTTMDFLCYAFCLWYWPWPGASVHSLSSQLHFLSFFSQIWRSSVGQSVRHVYIIC